MAHRLPPSDDFSQLLTRARRVLERESDREVLFACAALLDRGYVGDTPPADAMARRAARREMLLLLGAEARA